MKYTIDKTCEVCGVVFQVEPHRLKHGRGRTCSQKCGYVLRGLSQKTRYEVKCQRCGKPFETTDYKHQVYCSHKCRFPPVYGVCLNCGKEFRYSPSGQREYCTKKCADTSPIRNQRLSDGIKQAWQDETIRSHIMIGITKRSTMPEWYNSPHFRKGASNPRYKGNKQQREGGASYAYKTWRKDVMRRDDYTCQMCHKRGGKLQAHHIKHWAEYPELRYELDNGMTLCKTCHMTLHGLMPK